MAFRRDGGRAYRWARWVEERAAILRGAGLPADTVASQRDFEYLLLHGYNAAGWTKQAPWFDADSLTREQRETLRRLIDEYVRDFWPKPRHEEQGGRLPLSWLWNSSARPDDAPDPRQQ
jgi:hypothetical protein